MNIVTVVSLGKLSGCVPKIGIAHTYGSTVTLTMLGNVTKDGTNFTPNLILKKMLETNGLKATEANLENGNEN